ncbi:F-box protein SKIP19 [Rhynchospora pubera]|uniref:F-box protein SKIP19 n=1 Tax=Rhynchospora pubera TaxID=906938 RepID=A0AAV8GPQ8_9POAL|nr:F-box protein SKIP19 [Rhynchospora pubera]
MGKRGTMEVLRVAGSVCRSWRKVATQEPVLWRRIDMSSHDYYRSDAFKLVDPARLAIDRSGGRLEEFAAAYFADDYLLRYLCDRTSILKKLNLISSGQLSAAAIAETAERQPLLEEIQISCGPFSKKLTEILGTACPHLKSFELYYTSYNMPPPDPDNEEEISNDDEAFGIAKAMHKLHHLQLIGNRLTNEGLTAILDGCPRLETLDIRGCFKVNIDADMYAAVCTLCQTENLLVSMIIKRMSSMLVMIRLESAVAIIMVLLIS